MKKIELTQNKKAIIDNEDYEWLSESKWNTQKTKNTCYAVRRITVQSQNKQKKVERKQKVICMHRIILERKLKRSLKQNE